MWRAADAARHRAARRWRPPRAPGLLDVGAHVTLPPSARALGGLPARRPTSERRAAHGALAEATDADARAGPARLAPGAGRAASPTRTSRPSSSSRPAGRRRAAGSPPRQRSSRRAAALTTDPGAARRARARGGAAQPAGRRRSTRRSGCWRPRRPGRSTSSAAPARDLLHAEVAFAQNRGSDAPLLLLQAAEQLEPLDARLSRETYLDAWSAALFAGEPGERAAHLLDVSRAARAAPEPAGRPAPSDLLLDGFALLFTDGPRRGRAGAARRRRPRSPAPTCPSRRCCAGAGSRRPRPSSSGTTTPASTTATRDVRLARESGALEVLTVARQRAEPGGHAGRRLQPAPRC